MRKNIESVLLRCLGPFILMSAQILAGTSAGWAEPITIELGSTTFIADADTVTLTPRTFTLDLTPGVALTDLLQSGVFTINEATVDVATIPGTLSRSVTANGVTGTIEQPVRVSISPTMDILRLGPVTTTLKLDALRQLEITTVQTSVPRTALGPGPFSIQGTFLLTAVPDSLPGDFNQDGSVDAADFVVWRDGLGTVYMQQHYDEWRAHFGEPTGSSAAGYSVAASTAPSSAAVPESSALVLFLLGVLAGKMLLQTDRR
jgi:hypothetical protein